MEENITKLFREDLLKAVSIANRFVPLRPTLPVLGNLLLQVSRGVLTIAATNLETSIEIKLSVKDSGSWEITVPAKVFNEFLSSSVGKEVILEPNKEGLDIKTEGMQATVAGIAASEFPKIPTENKHLGLEFDQKELSIAVTKVAAAASIDESKPVLTGILIKNDEDKTILVATDGYRLSRKELANKINVEDTLISAKTLVEVLKISGELGEDTVKVSLSPSENQAVFTGENFLVAGRILSGVYPSFKQIIPTKFESVVSVKRNQLIEAIKAASVFARDIGNVVKIETDTKNNLKVSANTAQVGQGEAVISVENKGQPLKIAFNSRYFLDGLTNIASEDVEINFSGTLSPALLQDPKDKSFIYIVMPVKAQN